MKNYWRNMVVVILTTAMIVSAAVPAFADTAAETANALKIEVSTYVQNWVNENYTEHYILSDYRSQYLNFDLQGSKLNAHLLVEMNTTLKYNNVEALPYMQGVKELVGVDTVENMLLKTAAADNVALEKINGLALTDIQKVNFIDKINQQYEDASACIGAATPLTVDFVLKADIVDGSLSNIKLYEEIAGKLFPAEPFLTSTELQQNCITNLTSYLMDAASKSINFDTARAGSYDRIAARDYALKYTSNGKNPCNCGAISGGTGGGVDYNKWNNGKYPYESRFCHNDCTDYVSQALVAGGMITTAEFNRNKASWVNVSGLYNYLVSNGYAKTTTFEDCSAGHLVRMPGHIVMVTLNDTINHRYSGHTNDRLNINFSNKSDYTYYRITC